MAFSIIKADLELDKNEIFDFWKENFPGWPEKKYAWFYEKNPYGKASCWVARENHSAPIAGSAVYFPRPVSIEGELLPAGITGDFGVRKEHRGLGPAVSLQKALITASKEAHLSLLYGFPNNFAYSPKTRAGFKLIGYTIRMVRILKSDSYIRQHINNSVITTITSRSMDFLIRVLAKETRYHRNRNWTVELPDSFDLRFDRLWQRARAAYPIIGERTSQFLNWRFIECPYLKYNIFALTTGNGQEILGYIVYRLINKHIIIADLFFLKESHIIDALISEFLLYLRKHDYETVDFYFFGDPDLMNTFKKYFFFKRDDKRNVMVYFDPQSSHAALLANQNNWHLLEGDNDI